MSSYTDLCDELAAKDAKIAELEATVARYEQRNEAMTRELMYAAGNANKLIRQVNDLADAARTISKAQEVVAASAASVASAAYTLNK